MLNQLGFEKTQTFFSQKLNSSIIVNILSGIQTSNGCQTVQKQATAACWHWLGLLLKQCVLCYRPEAIADYLGSRSADFLL